jgi:hypothetical protein
MFLTTLGAFPGRSKAIERSPGALCYPVARARGESEAETALYRYQLTRGGTAALPESDFRFQPAVHATPSRAKQVISVHIQGMHTALAMVTRSTGDVDIVLRETGQVVGNEYELGGAWQHVLNA